MSLNSFVVLPVAASGPGSAVDVSGMGAAKTLVVEGPFDEAIHIEIANDLAGAIWSSFATFNGPGQKTISVAARWMRANTVGGGGGSTPDVGVGSTGAGSLFVQAVSPASTGVGAGADISTLPGLKTVVVDAIPEGALFIEVTEDGTNWNEVMTFQAADSPRQQSATFYGVEVRVRRVGDGAPDVWIGAANDGPGDASSPFSPWPTQRTIYARTTGDDATGVGTLARPYRTFQRAIQDVPHLIPPGQLWTVDITDLGTETLPANYQFPSIIGPIKTTLSEDFGGSVPFPFLAGSSFVVRAFPQPASNIPLADTHVPGADIVNVTEDALNGLYTIEVAPARASWAADALKGKFLTEEGNAFASCTIHSSDATHLYVCIRGVVPFNLGDLDIVEPSAHLEATITAAGDLAGIEILNCPQIAFHGIKFTCLDPDGFGPFAMSIQYVGGAQPRFELCDIQGLGAQLCDPNFTTFASVLRDRFFSFDAAAWTAQRCLLLDIPFLFVAGTSGNVTTASVMDGCPAFEGSGAHTTDGNFPSTSWVIGQCIFRNGTDPNGAVYGLHAGLFALDQVEIDNPAGNGITFLGAGVVGILKTVTGTSLDLGIRVNDGASVRVLDDDTDISGAGGDMEVGTLGVRTWADFRTALPGPAPSGKGIMNEYDLLPLNAGGFPVGDEVTGAGTGGVSGSRLFQRPS